MKQFKSRLIKKEREIITSMVQTISDPFGEFYITKDNLRLYLKQNTDILFSNLKKGDKIIYDNNSIILVIGFSDKNRRKYIKILTKSITDINNLLSLVKWNLDCDYWVKIKKNNPLLEALKNNNFIFFADRGRELLLVRYNKKEK